MRGVTTEVDKDNDTALVEVTDESARGKLIQKLLDAAGDDPRQLKILTGGRTQQYQVPLALAKKAGLIHTAASNRRTNRPADSSDSKTEQGKDSASEGDKPEE